MPLTGRWKIQARDEYGIFVSSKFFSRSPQYLSIHSAPFILLTLFGLVFNLHSYIWFIKALFDSPLAQMNDPYERHINNPLLVYRQSLSNSGRFECIDLEDGGVITNVLSSQFSVLSPQSSMRRGFLDSMGPTELPCS